MMGLKCPDCQHFLGETQRALVWHCYNCDIDITEKELRDVVFSIHQPLVVDNITRFLRGDDDEEEGSYDPGSLATALAEEDRKVTELKRITDGGKKDDHPIFPYSLEDLKCWVVKRRTGEVVRYSLSNESGIPGFTTKSGATTSTNSYTRGLSSYSDWCHHDPKPEPTWEWKKKGGQFHPMRLFIADAKGMRDNKDKFDIVVDCGDVLSDNYAERRNGLLVGDTTLVNKLNKYSLAGVEGPRVLKIDWDDRKAPLLHPEFWPDLAAILSGDVIINCMGGHGRSGTALVCLMMVMNPDYGSADAITHLRAVHCPRAIESLEQHKYIDEVADFLGREANSHIVSNVTNFKERFLNLSFASSKPYQERIKGEGVK